LSRKGIKITTRKNLNKCNFVRYHYQTEMQFVDHLMINDIFLLNT